MCVIQLFYCGMFSLLKLTLHKVDTECACFPHITKKINVPLLISGATSLVDEPRLLTSIDTPLIARSYNSNTASYQNLVTSKIIISIIQATTHLALPLCIQKLVTSLSKTLRKAWSKVGSFSEHSFTTEHFVCDKKLLNDVNTTVTQHLMCIFTVILSKGKQKWEGSVS